MSLAALVLSHNEEEFLPKCLDSLSWADEIWVIDKFSSDKTLDIARKYNAKILNFEGEHFDEWRNLPLKQVTCDWVLYIDPDERVSADLQKEIKEVMSQVESPLIAAYRMKRRNFWWGQEFTACGADNDYVTRLFKREHLEKWQGIIHESPVLHGETGELKHKLIHFTHRDLISGLQKSYQWTRFEAELFLASNHPPVVWWRLLKVPLQMFVRKYFFQGGYTHGTAGFIESAVQAWNRFMVYEQLWEMQQKPSIEEKYRELDK